MLVGDRRKFLAMLVTLRVEPDPETLVPTDRLTPEAKTFLEKECSLKVGTVTELLASPKDARVKLSQVLQNALQKVNMHVCTGTVPKRVLITVVQYSNFQMHFVHLQYESVDLINCGSSRSLSLYSYRLGGVLTLVLSLLYL